VLIDQEENVIVGGPVQVPAADSPATAESARCFRAGPFGRPGAYRLQVCHGLDVLAERMIQVGVGRGLRLGPCHRIVSVSRP
jgi:hypothetical protein